MEEFKILCEKIRLCELCKRMDGRSRVFSEKNGNIYSNVLFISEAPGRLGADKTRVPLQGDKSGDNFEKLILSIGWDRNDFFITNAVLCNPRDIKGRNDAPTKEEIISCSLFLKSLLDIMKPEFIITLGATALESLKYIVKHNYSLSGSVATLNDWNGCKLIPLYHTSPRAMIFRKFEQQLCDFFFLSKNISLRVNQTW